MREICFFEGTEAKISIGAGRFTEEINERVRET